MAKAAVFTVPGGKSGRHEDMGSLALMLATNHFINGESPCHLSGSLVEISMVRRDCTHRWWHAAGASILVLSGPTLYRI